jgi:O-methyltransferase
MFDVNYSLHLSELLRNAIGMQDFSRIVHICHYVLKTQHLDGDIVEFGCYVGNTTKLISSISQKRVHVYDSFDGLPDTYENYGGEMKVGCDALVANFKEHNVRLPSINRGWFSNIRAEQLPDHISFAHLDGDLYDSTMQPLLLIYDRMVPGGVILVDDYGADKWHGVKDAVTEFFKDKPESVVALSGLNGASSYKAFIRKI